MTTLGYSWTNIGSKSFSSGGATLTYYVDAKLTSQSVENNKSYIDTRARTYFTGYEMGGSGYSMSCTGCSTKSGTGVWWYSGSNHTTSHTYEETVLTGSVEISHADNGTGSLSMSGTCKNSYLGMDITASGSIDLPTIPRNSSITVFNNFTIEDGFSFTYKDELASKTLTLTCKIGNTLILSKTYTSSVGSHTDSITFTAAQLTTIYGAVANNSKTAEFTLSLSTSGITTVSTKKATGTLKASLNRPNLSNITVTEVGSVAALGVADNQVMRYLSEKVIRASASAQHGASVNSVRVVNGQVTANMGYMSSTQKYTSTTMSNLETGTFTVTVTDTRGFTTSATVTCELLDYTYPTITNVVFDRTSNIQDSGYVRANGTFWNKFPFADPESLQITLRAQIQIVGGGITSGYSTVHVGLPTNTSLSWSIEQLIPTGVLLRDQTYVCTVTVTDQYGQTATYTAQLGLAKRALWLGKYTVKAEGIVGEHWIGFYKVGDIFLTLNTENPANRFGGTWELIAQGRALIGAGSLQANTVNTWGDVTAGGFNPSVNERGGTYTHRHFMNGQDADGPRAAVGAVDSDVNSLGYVISSPSAWGPASTKMYALNAVSIKDKTADHTFNHYTPVFGYVRGTDTMEPYLAIYIWQKTA